MSLRFLSAGESHGPALVAILDGFPAGMPLTTQIIDEDLARRQKGYGAGPRMKIEEDKVHILGGVMAGLTTGGPIAFQIENRDHDKWHGKAIDPFTTPRPGHADLSGTLKYGYRDLRPALERASARETAARVAAGAVCRQLLLHFDITIGGYVRSIGEITATSERLSYFERIRRALDSDVSCADELVANAIRARIREVMDEKETLGGVVEAVALGLPAGLGSYMQWDRRLEARLGAALLSIPAIKGVEIGPAFENSTLPGTQAQDPILLEGNVLVRPTNRNGGLEGGVTTGQPLVVRVAFKPIATTLTPQPSVDLARGEETTTNYERSDFCPVPRAVVIVEAMMALVLADALMEKLGGDSLSEMSGRFKSLRQARLEDLPMDNLPHIWWPE